MDPFHTVRFMTSNGITKIYVDDQEVKGCTHAEFVWDVNNVPVVKLELMSTVIQVETDKAEIIQDGGKNADIHRRNKRTGKAVLPNA